MIPGSLDDGEPIGLSEMLASFRKQVRRYFWLWIAWQTVKGITTTTFVWAPIAYLYFFK